MLFFVQLYFVEFSIKTVIIQNFFKHKEKCFFVEIYEFWSIFITVKEKDFTIN